MRQSLIYILWHIFIASYILFPLSVLADDWIYTIRPGDNLWNLTEKHLTDFKYVTRLQQLNNIRNPYEIRPGEKIRIPLDWTKEYTGNAQIVIAIGNIIVQRNKSQVSISAKPEMQLFIGDEIQTEKDAITTIEFADKSRLQIQESSRVRLSYMSVHGDMGLAETTVELLYGRVENAVPTDSEIGSRFKIKTPVATSSVRGTDFRIGMLNGESTVTEVLAGLIEVSGQNRAVNVPGGFGAVTKSGLPPSSPVMLLPAPDLSMMPKLYEKLPLVISFNILPEAKSYRAQIATDNEFQNILADLTTLTSPFRAGDIPDGDYWLRIRGIDSSGIEGRDGIIAFTLNARPEPPLIMAPLPDTVVDGKDLEFLWAVQPEAMYYLVEINQTENFSGDTLFQTEVVGENLRLPDLLDPGQYFWRIASVSASEGAGPFSDIMTFRVPVPGPALADVDVDDSEITIVWPASDGHSYYYQFSRDKEFSEILYEQQTTDSFVKLPNPGGGSYFVRIKIIEADGFAGSYGQYQVVDIPYATPYWLLLLLLPLFILL